jgi:hypothetical protein
LLTHSNRTPASGATSPLAVVAGRVRNPPEAGIGRASDMRFEAVPSERVKYAAEAQVLSLAVGACNHRRRAHAR